MAADLIAHLGSDGPLDQQSLAAGDTLHALVALFCLQHTQGTLEEVGGEIAHLAYERSQDVIVMKGYKFARAKIAAAAALGVVSVLDPGAAAAIAREEPITDELCVMLLTGRSQVRLVAAAFIADLAGASADAKEALLSQVRGTSARLHTSTLACARPGFKRTHVWITAGRHLQQAGAALEAGGHECGQAEEGILHGSAARDCGRLSHSQGPHSAGQGQRGGCQERGGNGGRQLRDPSLGARQPRGGGRCCGASVCPHRRWPL